MSKLSNITPRVAYYLYNRKRIGRLIVFLALLFSWGRAFAQPYDTTLNTALTTAKQVIAQHQITLAPGFSGNGVNGTIRLSILPAPIFTCNPLGASLSAGMNYISTLVPRQPFTDASALASKNVCEVMQSIQYLDGLGRPLQTVQVKGNPDATRDLIQPFEYDVFGREVKKDLPYTTVVGNPGSYRADALTAGAGQAAFYNTIGQNYKSMSTPFAITGIEPSPLNRPVEQGAPGTDWQLGTHTVKTDYLFNNVISYSDTAHTRAAALYRAGINSDQSRTLSRAGSNTAVYDAGQLYVTVNKDENWSSGRAGTVEEYKDKEGHVVLKRTFNYNNGTLETLSTYYVYDDKEMLAFVLPPAANPDNNAAISQTTLDNLCYQYQYDGLGRLSAKKLPGKGWEYMVYNLLDQVVFTRDANQAALTQWAFVKYDGAGRVIMTGLEDNNASIPKELQDYMTYQLEQQTFTQWETRSASGGVQGYTNTAFPNGTNVRPLTVNYYDDYTMSGMPYDYHTGYSAMTRSLPTAVKTAVLNTPSDMLWSVHYYDDLGRSTKTYTQHYLGGVQSGNNYDEVSVAYDFTNAVINTTRQHHTAAASGAVVLTVADSLVYDHMGRKVQSWNRINSNTKILLSQTEYNELGQLYTKKLYSTDNGANFLQKVQYAYNERGWLTASMAGLFSMQLNYNDGARPQYNGNIAGQSWLTSGQSAKSYTYVYDKLNRLLSGAGSDGYIERSISYDLGGNIKTLSRLTNGTLTDSLTYSYTNGNASNQISTIADASGSSVGMPSGSTTYNNYDGNGNTVYDGRNAATIIYNMLNLPQSIAAKSTTYTYDAMGQKLRRVAGTATTDYIGGIEYDGSTSTSPSITFVQTAEGRVLNVGGTPNYEFSLTDHLGNSRVNFDSSSGGVVKQADDYYPFGMEISRGTVTSPKNEYLYNRKELQEGLGQYDYGTRLYDPVIARWTSIDQLAEKYQLFSPYTYVANNPLRFIDEDGREIVIPTMKGDLTYRNGQFYQENGKVYKGKDAFITKTLGALQTLSKLKDPTVKSVLKTLETSKEKVSLEAGYDGGITYPEDPSAVNEGKSTGSIISLDYTIKGEDGKNVESEILVGHELSHAYDNLKGNNKGEANTKSSASKKGEIRAVKFENRIRKEEGKKERTTYGGVPIKNK